MPKEVDINELEPLPRNELIYGQEDLSDLVAQIEERGRIVMPIIVNTDNIILFGHRRRGAAKALDFKTVPCEVRTFESAEDELEFLLHLNVTRKKSREQMAREGIALEEVLSVQSLERRNVSLKQFLSVRDESSLTDNTDSDNDVSTTVDTDIAASRSGASAAPNVPLVGLQDGSLPDATEESLLGRTRDEVAKALRIGSGKQFDRMKAVIRKVDDLKEQGKSDDCEMFIALLNRAPSAAYDLLEVDLSSLSDEDKHNLKSGKVSPCSLKPEEKAKNEKIISETAHGASASVMNDIERGINIITKNIHSVKDN